MPSPGAGACRTPRGLLLGLGRLPGPGTGWLMKAQHTTYTSCTSGPHTMHAPCVAGGDGRGSWIGVHGLDWIGRALSPPVQHPCMRARAHHIVGIRRDAPCHVMCTARPRRRLRPATCAAVPASHVSARQPCCSTPTLATRPCRSTLPPGGSGRSACGSAQHPPGLHGSQALAALSAATLNDDITLDDAGAQRCSNPTCHYTSRPLPH